MQPLLAGFRQKLFAETDIRVNVRFLLLWLPVPGPERSVMACPSYFRSSSGSDG